jgi:hypothetical protein
MRFNVPASFLAVTVQCSCFVPRSDGSNVQGSMLDFRCSMFNIEATPKSLFLTKRHNALIVMKFIVLINNALCSLCLRGFLFYRDVGADSTFDIHNTDLSCKYQSPAYPNPKPLKPKPF